MLYVSAHENNTGLIFVIQKDKLINKRLRTAFTKKLFSADLLFLFQSGRKAASFLKVHNTSVDLLGGFWCSECFGLSCEGWFRTIFQIYFKS